MHSTSSSRASEASSDSSLQNDADNRMSSINAQLLAHGWTKRPLNLSALAEQDHADVVGALYELLGSSMTNLETVDSLLAKHRTLAYEHERLAKSHAHRNLHIARVETEMQGWKARCVDLERRLNNEENKVKELREEIGRGKKALETVRVAAGHEAKKMQIKLDKANEQLRKLSNDASLLSRPQGLTVLNSIPSGRSAPPMTENDPLLEQSLRDLVEIRQSLQEETEAFRHVVVTAGNSMRDALAAHAGEDAPSKMGHVQFFSPLTGSASRLPTAGSASLHASTAASHASLANARLQSLISALREKLLSARPAIPPTEMESEVEEEDAAERQRQERESAKAMQDLEDRVKDLQVEVACAKAKEEEANRLLAAAAQERMPTGTTAKQVEDLAEEIEDVRAHSELARLQDAFEAEQRRFAREEQRFATERRKLEVERQAFIEERRQADIAAMRAYLPSTPSEPEAGPSRLPPSPAIPPIWEAHRPASPSPLSPRPAKISTPKGRPSIHAARRKSVKTPLSRLVLEKAVRSKSKEAAVLGIDGGRRTNIEKRTASGAAETLKSARSSSGSSGTASSGPLKSSMKPVKTLAQSQKRPVDLTRSTGIGPAAAAARPAKVWR